MTTSGAVSHMTPNELFAAISPELANEILEYTHANDKQLYRGAVEVVAQARKVRPVFLDRQPRTERHASMRAVLARPSAAMAADNLLRNWLLKKQNVLLVEFLDTLKIKHDKGVVENIPASVDDSELKQAVDALLAKHSPEVVSLYLHAFNAMDDARWPNLTTMLETDPRLELPGLAPG
jgi:hypothetical protein